MIGAYALEKHHLAIKYVDIENNNWLDDLKDAVNTIIIGSERLPMTKIDGLGTQRIVDKIMELLK